MFLYVISIDKMAGHLYNALCGKDTQLVTGENNLPIHEGDESFLREVVTPIYQVIQKVEHFSCNLPL